MWLWVTEQQFQMVLCDYKLEKVFLAQTLDAKKARENGILVCFVSD